MIHNADSDSELYVLLGKENEGLESTIGSYFIDIGRKIFIERLFMLTLSILNNISYKEVKKEDKFKCFLIKFASQTGLVRRAYFKNP